MNLAQILAMQEGNSMIGMLDQVLTSWNNDLGGG